MKIKRSDWSLVKQNGRKGDRRRGCRGIGKKAAFLECSLGGDFFFWNCGAGSRKRWNNGNYCTYVIE